MEVQYADLNFSQKHFLNYQADFIQISIVI